MTVMLNAHPNLAASILREVDPVVYLSHSGVDWMRGYAECAQRHARELEERVTLPIRRLFVDDCFIAVGAQDRERGYSLGENRRVHRGAVNVDRGHTADAEETTGRYRIQHEVLLSEKRVKFVLSDAWIHGDLVGSGSQNHGVLAVRSQIRIARHVHQISRWQRWHRATIVICDQ